MFRRLCRSLSIAAVVLAAGVTDAVAQRTLSADDHTEILALYATYNHAIDLGDPEAWANTFVADGTFLDNRGHDELRRFAAEWVERYEGASRHWNSQHLFTATPSGARGSAYLHLLDVRTSPPTTVLTGVYEDDLVRTPDGWRFRARTLRIDRPSQPDGTPRN